MPLYCNRICSCEKCQKAVVDECNQMLAHWNRKSDKELYAKIVYTAIASHHACQDGKMKKLVAMAANRLVGSSDLDDLKKAYKVLLRTMWSSVVEGNQTYF